MKSTVRLRVGEIAKERNINTSKLAKMTGLTFVTSSALIRGHFDRIGMTTIAALCDGLNVTPADLFEVRPADPPSAES